MKGVILAGAMALSVVPAGAFKTGFTYLDGSDSIFGGLPTPREKFEATIQGEFDGATVMELKGLSHPTEEGHSKARDWIICGMARDITHNSKEFKRFWYSDESLLAQVEPRRESVTYEGFLSHYRDMGCERAIGLDG
uniref:hypothetical protein n=1 Tax=Brucella pseudintermedia TaxID=370111 RepID=UPI00158C4C49|nr:hypothetical protein [Brucella pseudintermedia]